jgi:hypothetical protein
MNVLIEKVLIPVLILLCIALALYNPMQLEPETRIIGTVLTILLLMALAFFLNRQNTYKSASTHPNMTHNIPSEPSMYEAQTATKLPANEGRIGQPSTKSEGEHIDINYIVALYTTHTAAQADMLAEHYLGRRILLSGTVLEVKKYSHREMSVLLSADGVNTASILRFGEKWNSRLYTLRREERLSVAGTVYTANGSGVDLKDCEIL